MDILFFAFANDRDNPLAALEAEDNFIYSLLAPRQAQAHFVIHRDQSVSIEKLAEYLTLYRNNIVLFHYSGHAGKEHLSLDDERASALGIAEMLGNCPRLKAVILNGCSTAGQVAKLLEKQIPLVIATSSPIEDHKAKEFAIQFYRSLSNQESINQAFEAARAKVLTIESRTLFSRGILTEEVLDTPVWGIFYNEDQVDAYEWSLPIGTTNNAGTELVVNELLLDTLVSTFASYNPDVKKIWENQAYGGTVSLLDKRDAVLRCLPHPVSEQVRKLLVPDPVAENGLVFFDQVGIPRLGQIATVYDTIMELTGFIMMAQLWESLNHIPTLKINNDTKAEVKKFLTLNSDEREKFNFIPLINKIRTFLNENNIQYFIDEFQHISDIFKEGEPFFEACQFLDSIKSRTLSKKVSEEEAITLCILAEEELSEVLKELGFIARYTFASVKNIGVVKYRHLKEAKFKHHIVRLVQRFVGLEEEISILEEYMDTASILLMKEKSGQSEFLNLSPFIIDENAFDEKATIAKLYYFDRYNRDRDMYVYRHVYKPNDTNLLIANQKNYMVIKAQFEAFAEMLFHHSMRQLP